MDILVTYSLLSTIKDRSENLTSFLELYKELTEGILHGLKQDENGKGLIEDLKEAFDTRYGIPIPYPTLKLILQSISKEHKQNFSLFSDYSFDFKTSCFQSLDTEVSKEQVKIDELKKVYMDLCEEKELSGTIGLDYFVDFNKRELLGYLNDDKKELSGNKEFEVLKSIIAFDEYREIFKKLVLGSIISAYFEIDVVSNLGEKVFLLDTNFIVSLLDLHSKESKLTCEEIVQIARRSKFQVHVLPETIREVRNLLLRKAGTVDRINVFVQQDKHTIEHGCYRRGLSGSDLKLIASKIEKMISRDGIIVLSENENRRLRSGIRKTEIYKTLSERGFNPEGIIHDAMALNYVKKIRKAGEVGFAQTSAFFVNDSHSLVAKTFSKASELPLTIRAEDLLNILWLMSPTSSSFLSRANISNVFSVYLSKRLPSKDMLKSMDQKIRSLESIPIDIEDCAMIAVNISERDASDLIDFIDSGNEIETKKSLVKLSKKAEENKKQELEESIRGSQTVLSIVQRQMSVQKEEILLKEKTIKEIEEASIIKVEQSEIEKRQIVNESNRKMLSELVKQDTEEMELIDDQIDEIRTSLSRMVRLLAILLSLLLIGLIAYFGIALLLPNWSKLEPITYLVGLVTAVIIFLLRVFSRKLTFYNLFDFAITKLSKKRVNRYERLEKRKNKVKERMMSRLEDLQNY